MTYLTRRQLLALVFAGFAIPGLAQVDSPKEISWDDLIPPGVPYAEIIGNGELDLENDTWRPIYDPNATKLNEELNDLYVRIPGFITPLAFGPKGVTEFVLVPYLGACIHTPPPPANQLVFVNTAKPWPSDELWNPVWVTGRMTTKLTSTEIAETGYALEAERIEVYEWESGALKRAPRPLLALLKSILNFKRSE